jgi:hypothetical protein
MAMAERVMRFRERRIRSVTVASRAARGRPRRHGSRPRDWRASARCGLRLWRVRGLDGHPRLAGDGDRSVPRGHRHGIGPREPATELLQGIDWCLKKLSEHDAIGRMGLVVVADLARVVVVVGQSLRFGPGPLLQHRLIEEVLLGGQPTEGFAELAVVHRRVTGVTNVGILDHGDEVPLELIPLETSRVA